MGSVIPFEKPKATEPQTDRELDQFYEARCLMLQAFTALAERGGSRADLADEVLSTTNAMHGLIECLCEKEDAANAG